VNRVSRLALLALSLTACATGYHSVGSFGGYQDLKVDKNAWTVSFSGNGYTSDERANDFTLLRCAEVTLANGFNFFIITEARRGDAVSSYTTPVDTQTTVSRNGDGTRSETTTVSGGDTYVSVKPGRSNSIRAFVDRPAGDMTIYDAALISKELRAKYSL
jgi:hypothetical protein